MTILSCQVHLRFTHGWLSTSDANTLIPAQRRAATNEHSLMMQALRHRRALAGYSGTLFNEAGSLVSKKDK